MSFMDIPYLLFFKKTSSYLLVLSTAGQIGDLCKQPVLHLCTQAYFFLLGGMDSPNKALGFQTSCICTALQYLNEKEKLPDLQL